MRIYLTELRRSPLLWWFPVFVLLDFAGVFGRSLWWIGVWPQASAAAQIPSLFFAPVLAAGAAWAAGRVKRNRMVEQSGAWAVARWRVELVQILVTLTFGLAAFLLGAFAAAIASMPEAGPGFLWPSYLLLGSAVLLGSVGIGHLAGALSSSRYATPVICALAVFVFIASLPSSLGMMVLSGDPQVKLAPAALGARLLLVGGLAALAIVGPGVWAGRAGGWRVRSRRAAQAFAPISLVVVSAAGVVTAGPIVVQRPIPAESERACTSTTPAICFWPEDRKYLPMATEMVGRLKMLPAGMFVIPDTFYELGLRDPRQSLVDFKIIEGSAWSLAAISTPILAATFPTYCPAKTDAEEDRWRQAHWELGQWLMMWLTGGPRPANVHGGPPGIDIDAIGQVALQPQDRQIAWATERLATIRSKVCA